MEKSNKMFALIDAMNRKAVSTKDVAALLNITTASILNKLSGKTQFTIREAFILCDTYLFSINLFREDA